MTHPLTQPDVAQQLRDHAASDHQRGCMGRQYSCSCGYDAATEALLTSAATEIERLRATPAQPAGMREALEKCADYVKARHNANIGWWNDPYAWQTLEHVIKPALALPAERPAVAQESREPIAWIVQWRTPHTPKTVSAYVKEDDARRAAKNVSMYADASDVTVCPAYAVTSTESK